MKRKRYDEKLERQKQILFELEDGKHLRPKREIFGVKTSEDHGQNWQVVAICAKCFSQIMPPKRAIKEIESGVGACDWCGASNKQYLD